MDILGARIRIRPCRHEDLPFLQTLWNDGAVMRYHGYPHGMQVTEESMEQWWAMTQRAEEAKGGDLAFATPYCVIERLDGTLIGEFAYSFDAQQRASVDLKLAPEYWKQGYAGEALVMALRDIFATTPVKKIVVEPLPDNAPALALMRRCGFQPAPTENHPYRWECTRTDFAQCELIGAEKNA